MSKDLIPAQRKREILQYLEAHQVVRTAALRQLLGASEATIRRDLEQLEREGVLERTHGGAVRTQRMPVEPAYAHSALVHPNEKRWIGREAAALVDSGDTVYLNSGTTIAEVARHLAARSELQRITVITNSLTAALEMIGADFEIILLGGAFRPLANSTFGPFATGSLRQTSADKAFIGIDGITLKYGCTTPATAEAEVGQVMIERTRGPVVVVADSSKWGVVSNFEIARLDQIDGLMTDPGLSPSAREALLARSLRLRIAGPESGLPQSVDDHSLAERPHVPVR
jgi:DeoR family fructose operon transcriptional repressor